MRFSPRTLLLLLSVCMAVAPRSLAQANLTIATDSGPVRGKESGDGKVRLFLGIPYAAPPVGPLRWKPPQPPAPWKDAKDATQFASRCIQIDLFKGLLFRDPGPSEDCLYLNVWTPAAKDFTGKLPVLVWIHGGGFHCGGPSEPRNDGEAFARKGVTVVSMAYRLGILGFLATHELADESPQHAAGNYGLMDQAFAIRWVKNNIAAFGGDPANITIIGESAGAWAVTSHMASPLSRDLIARVIGESGGALGLSAVPMKDLPALENEDEKLLKNHVHAEKLADLRAIPAADLIQRVAARTFGTPLFYPGIDGYFLTELPAATFAAGKQAKVPYLAGWNKDELGIARVKVNLQQLNGIAFAKYKFHAGEFLKAYHVTNDAEANQAAADLSDDEFIAFATWASLEAQAASGVPQVYRFRFDLGVPDGPKHPASWGAYHSDEMDYVFGTLDARPDTTWRPEDYKLSQLMQSYWINFARSGNPNGEGLPNWPAYGPTAWQVMHLDAVSSARPDDRRDRYLFLQKYWK